MARKVLGWFSVLHWFRGLDRAIAIALLVSLAALGVSSAVPHGDGCHGCVQAAVPHDPSQHAIGAPAAPADHPLHCVVCHWTRLHRPSIELVHDFARPTARHLRVHVESVAIEPLFPAAQPPLRSPPHDSPLA